MVDENSEDFACGDPFVAFGRLFKLFMLRQKARFAAFSLQRPVQPFTPTLFRAQSYYYYPDKPMLTTARSYQNATEKAEEQAQSKWHAAALPGYRENTQSMKKRPQARAVVS